MASQRTLYKLLLAFVLISSSVLKTSSQNREQDSIPISIGIDIQKPIYTDEQKKHGDFYKWAWGEHYRNLYYKPVTAKTISLSSSYGGLSPISQLPMLHAFILKNNKQQIFMLKPIGGSSSFLESKFFRDIYRHEDFKDTYLNDFIKDAYTIVHPYMFLVTEDLAKASELSNSSSHIYYMTENIAIDSIRDDNQIKNKLVSISNLPNIDDKKVITDTKVLIDTLHKDNNTRIDEELYIRLRLFDMLVGDWNKTPENWYWIPSQKDGKTTYVPEVVDRSHAFTKVDGVLFKELLGMLGVGFITNYEARYKNIKKFNTLAFAMDIALAQKMTAADWQQQAQKLKEELTDEEIDIAFSRLPQEMQSEETYNLKRNLKERKRQLDDIALKYYTQTQKNPVVTGTDRNERFVIEQDRNKDLRIKIYDAESDTLVMDKKYERKRTKEIWLYGLGGNDTFVVDKEKKNISLLLIGGSGDNTYDIKEGKNVYVYESEAEKERLKDMKQAKVIIPNDEKALEYDYTQQRHTSFSVTPIGIYDSDLGLNIGTSVSYTIYGFRRAPYTRRHQISYDFNNGLTYQGIFPSYDERKSFHVLALVGSPAYFSNFFGFGNNTDGHKDKSKKYNRVNIRKYMLTPALYYNINKDNEFNIFSSFEIYDVKNPDGRNRYINEVFDDDSDVFKAKYFMNLGAAYEFKKKTNHFLSSISIKLSTGWNVNLSKPQNNYAYATGQFGINLKLTDRLTFATLFKGKLLFSDKYEFYQAATTELRGFRDNRFIGKQSFYQYSDIRWDMGRLNNPFTPLNYGVFAGADHGRVWCPGDNSDMWHSSYGGGFWLTLLRKFTGKFSYFGSSDGGRFMFQLGMGF